MRRPQRTSKALLVRVARAIVDRMKVDSGSTKLKLRKPSRACSTNTDGWSVAIGRVGTTQISLEIWLDRFAVEGTRRFYACFRSHPAEPLKKVSRKVQRRLWPVRRITNQDLSDTRIIRLMVPLRHGEFNSPIYEGYDDDRAFFGIYDGATQHRDVEQTAFVNRAVEFFLDAAQFFGGREPPSRSERPYARYENQQKVRMHVSRERSSLLANECKCRDNWSCRVCGFRFEDAYGEAGRGFAEAHHIVPLAKLRGRVLTKLSDLITVCANCHRMLHRMPGASDDVAKLRRTVRAHTRRAG